MPFKNFPVELVKGIIIYVIFLPWLNVVTSGQNIVITRHIYDVVLFPDCGGKRKEDFNCDNVVENSIRTNDTDICGCQCKKGYLVYRDPMVRYDGDNLYSYDVKSKGCVWYGTYREGCHVLENVAEEMLLGDSFSQPIILDLSKPGNVTLKSEHYVLGCLNILPYLRRPGRNEWERMNNVSFQLEDLRRTNNTRKFFLLKWLPADDSESDIYQGMLIRLDLQPCFPSVALKPDCIMAKTSGSYTVISPTVSPSPSLFPSVPLKPSDMVPTTISSEQHIPNKTYVTIVVPCERPWIPEKTKPDYFWFDYRFIIGISTTLVLILIIMFVILICLCVRRRTGKKLKKRSETTLSNETLREESPYATIPLSRPTRRPTHYKNLGYRQSIEMTPPLISGVTRGYVHVLDAAHPTTRRHSHISENPTVYNMPAADYSLICTPTLHNSQSLNRPLPSPGSSSAGSINHVYSVLERENDPLKYPHPIDNDRVFVEFNPIYGTHVGFSTNECETQVENPQVIYENASELTTRKRISDIPEDIEKDVEKDV